MKLPEKIFLKKINLRLNDQGLDVGESEYHELCVSNCNSTNKQNTGRSIYRVSQSTRGTLYLENYSTGQSITSSKRLSTKPSLTNKKPSNLHLRPQNHVPVNLQERGDVLLPVEEAVPALVRTPLLEVVDGHRQGRQPANNAKLVKPPKVLSIQAPG